MGFCAQSKSVERGLTRRSYLTLNDECPSNNKLLLRPHRQQGSFSGRQGHIQEAANNSSLLHARTQFLVLEPRPGYGNSSNNACTWRAFAHFDARASQGSKAGRLRRVKRVQRHRRVDRSSRSPLTEAILPWASGEPSFHNGRLATRGSGAVLVPFDLIYLPRRLLRQVPGLVV